MTMRALVRAATLAAAALPSARASGAAVGATPHEATCQDETCPVAEEPKADLDLASLLQLHNQKQVGMGNDTDGENAQIPEQPCLCTFSVDRTLTARQGQDTVTKCYPKFRTLHNYPNIADNFLGNAGGLTSSQVATGIQHTFCRRCFIGVVSARSAGGKGSDEREKLFQQLSSTSDKSADPKWGLFDKDWSGPTGLSANPAAASVACTAAVPPTVNSALVSGCSDGTKHFAIVKIIDHIKNKFKKVIDPKNAYHFDDNDKNLVAYKGLNSIQVSCGSRDHKNKDIGWCGAVWSEIQPLKGVNKCGALTDYPPNQ